MTNFNKLKETARKEFDKQFLNASAIAPTKEEVYPFIFQSMEKAYQLGEKAGEEDGFTATRLLWDRMKDWNEEWQKEMPKERDLESQDALKLIEWKIKKAYQTALEDVLEHEWKVGLDNENEMKEMQGVKYVEGYRKGFKGSNAQWINMIEELKTNQ